VTYVDPTASDLKARYPAFAGVDDATIGYWLTDAHRFVDTSWPIEDDYGPALIARAAHEMVEAKVSGIAQDEVEELAGFGLTQFKSGSFSASFSEAAAAQATEGGLASTKYGREYLALLRRNKGGPGTTGPGCVPAPCGFNGYAGPLPPYCP
jgi:hypothetical protein